jgi:hypothetical protein
MAFGLTLYRHENELPNSLMREKKPNRYQVLISRIFHDHFKPGLTEFEFERKELQINAEKLKIKLPDNLGDVIYSFRYRTALPKDITETAAKGKEWIIVAAGRSKYRFKLSRVSRIIPREDLLAIKIPDATPEIITAYALSDEQALLAKVRYNRLIDIFLGITTYSLQSHLRTTVPDMGQIEIDELYVGINKKGQQFVIPVQAKGGTDQLATVQTAQDIACCLYKFPALTCRSISAQFMPDNTIALFELTIERDETKIVEERHYQLVSADAIQPEDLKRYATRS